MWISSVASIQPSLDARHTEGSSSMAVKAQGFVSLKSRPFPLTQALASTLSVDFFVPSQQPNPNFYGQVQLVVDCPSKNVFSQFIGQVDFTGKPLNAFSRLNFPVPSNIASAIGSSCEDFDIAVNINVPTNATGTYLVDNLLGITAVANTPLPTGEFEVPMIVQDRSFRTDGIDLLPDGAEPAARDAGRHAGRAPLLDPELRRRHAGRERDGVAEHGRQAARLPVPAPQLAATSASTSSSSRTGCRSRSSARTVATCARRRPPPRCWWASRSASTSSSTSRSSRRGRRSSCGTPSSSSRRSARRRIRTTTASSCSSRSKAAARCPPKPLPSTLNSIATLTPNRPSRILIQNVQTDDAGNILQAELDGQLFHTETTELPTVGSTDDWMFVNTTPLTHNKHVHLIEFQVIDRRTFDDARVPGRLEGGQRQPALHAPDAEARPDPLLHRTGRRPARRRVGLEGHGPHAGPPGHAHPRSLGAAAARHGRRHAGPEPVPVRSDRRGRASSGTATCSSTRTTR